MESEWEIIQPRSNAGAHCYGEDWLRAPCVSVSIGGLALNECACELLEVEEGSVLCVLVNKSARKVAFKKPAQTDHEGLANGWVVRNRGMKGKSLRIGARITAAFPDSLGCAYRLAATSDRITEMSIQPSNCVGRRPILKRRRASNRNPETGA